MLTSTAKKLIQPLPQTHFNKGEGKRILLGIGKTIDGNVNTAPLVLNILCNKQSSCVLNMIHRAAINLNLVKSKPAFTIEPIGGRGPIQSYNFLFSFFFFLFSNIKLQLDSYYFRHFSLAEEKLKLNCVWWKKKKKIIIIKKFSFQD